MKKKVLLPVATIIVATIVATAFYFISFVGTQGHSSSTLTVSTVDDPLTTDESTDTSESIEALTSHGNDSVSHLNEETAPQYNHLETLAKANTLQKKLIQLGYLIPPDFIAAYESYTEDALLQMAEYGDMVAIKALQNKYAKAEQWDAFRDMQEEAVLQGSISDISDLHDIEFSSFSGEESRERLIKSAAYAELAALRGSQVTVFHAITNFNESGITFSSSELTQIKQMANDMLNQINQERQERGKDALIKIDDSQFISHAPNTSSSGWGQEFVTSR